MGRLAGTLSVSAVLLAGACRPTHLALDAVTFSCRAASECAPGFVCAQERCVREDDVEPPGPVQGGPVISALDVARALPDPSNEATVFAAGEALRVTVTVTAPNGLPARPLALLFTEDNRSWRDLTSQRVVEAPFDDASWYTAGADGAPVSVTTEAPTGSFFRLKAAVRDSAGLRDLFISDVLNVSRWRLYAGSQSAERGAGLDAKRLRVAGSADSNGLAAVDPSTGDVYAVDTALGSVYRVDARTGLSSLAFRLAALSDTAPGAPLPRVPTLVNLGGTRSLGFDPAGRAYVMSQLNGATALLAIDFAAKTARHYLGGGTDFSDAPTAPAAVVTAGAWTFDAQGALFYLARCSSGDGVRLMKASQTVDSAGKASVGAISRVAGACTRGPVVSGAEVNATPLLGTTSAVSAIRILPVDERVMYVNDSYINGPVRFFDGRAYPRALSHSRGMVFDRARGQVVITTIGRLLQFQPSYEERENAEAVSTFLSATGRGRCTLDGLDAVTDGGGPCLAPIGELELRPDGGLLFFDGLIGATRPYRLRTLDGEGRIQTVLGTLPLTGETRQRVQWNVSAVAVKPADAPNQETFPAGVYFTDGTAGVFGRIEPDTHPTRPGGITVLWGTMNTAVLLPAPGTLVSDAESLMLYHPTLSFDALGRPVLMTPVALTRLSATGAVEHLTGGVTAQTWSVAPNIRSVNVQEWPNAQLVTDTGVFLAGTGCPVSAGASCTEAPRIRYFPFSGAPARTVIGGAARTFTADIDGPADVQAATLSVGAGSGYTGSSGLVQWPYMAFDPDAARLYFVEGANLRFVQNPLTSNVDGALGTVFNEPRGVGFFTFNPPGGPYAARSMVFYFSRDNGVTQLFCRGIAAGAATWCPPAGALLGHRVPNLPLADNVHSSLAWKTPTELLVRGGGVLWVFDAR
ncbi:MAG: hypothetical protein JNG84_02055 [Archangium sp.]|nr:hypothetical protein [Archangium sp.]